MVFAVGSRNVLSNGEIVEEDAAPYEGSDGIYIPSELASKYVLTTASDLSEADIENLGLDVYISEKYDFIAIGEDLNVDDTNEETIIMKFGVYVSADGKDTNKGYPSSPVKTLSRAKTLYENNNGREIIVHSGDYRFSETLAFTSEHDGMTVKNYGDGEVKFKGSVELPSAEFTGVTDSAVLEKIPESAREYVKQISLKNYVTEDMIKYPEYAPQSASTAYYELFSGDTAQTIARWPNAGFNLTSSVSGNSFAVDAEKAELWKNAENGIIAGYFAHEWAFEDIYIDRENTGNSKVALSKTPVYGLEDGQRYYVMNMLEELDVPGEYYIDPTEKILYYYPTNDFSSVNPELSILTGNLISISSASDITFEGITFEQTRGNGIYSNGGNNITIDNCVIKNIGNGGIIINSTDSKVINSDIFAIGGTAVRISAGSNESLTAGNVIVKNNKIHNFGRIFRTYQGAVNINGCGNTAEYNTIYDAPHCALRFSGSNHTINNNEIYNVVYECSDSGAIYAGRNWISWGNKIKNNYIHDILRAEGLTGHSVAAVYCDDQLTGTTVEGNVFENCYRPALFGGGTGNILKNNTVVNCETGVQYDNRGRTYEANIAVPDTDDTSDNLYEEFIKFLAKSSVHETLEYRKANFNGFSSLLTDVESYQSDSSYEMGYPKCAVIIDNVFYGSNVNNEGYEDIYDDVKRYGTVSGNIYSQTIGEYLIPDCGVRL